MLSQELRKQELSLDQSEAIQHQREALLIEIRESQEIIERSQELVRQFDEMLAKVNKKR